MSTATPVQTNLALLSKPVMPVTPGTATTAGEVGGPRFEYFLALPPEIRVMVYNLVLQLDKPIVPTRLVAELFYNRRSLFYVNKLVSTEARRQYYVINTFRIGRRPRSTEKHPIIVLVEWLRRLRTNAHSLRHLQCEIGYRTNQAEFDLILGNLTTACALAPNLQTLKVRFCRALFNNTGILRSPFQVQDLKRIRNEIRDMVKASLGNAKKVSVVSEAWGLHS